MRNRSIAGIFVLLLGAFAVLAAPAQAATAEERREAGRLLAQASFGPTREEINRVAQMGAEAWIDEQLGLAPSLHYPLWRERDIERQGHGELQGVWLELAVYAPDQLRQRVAFALSEILVVSSASDIPPASLVTYYDILVRGAFGNYRALLGNVSRSMAMGRFLSMYQNRKPNPAQGIRADENFARELMQLFTIGLIDLDPDGSPQLDSEGRTSATYNQRTVENMARVFTGWSSSGTPEFWTWPPVWTAPMAPWENFHDTDEKRILGKRFAAGRTARADMDKALNTLFNHQNVGPFLSRQLIQRLVTSNPTPQYIARVAAVFDDNGAGVRGDLGAVVRAILLDTEARSGHIDLRERFGKPREPLLRLTHILRAFGATSTGEGGRFPPQYLQWGLEQAPLASPTVFNFFSPAYAPDGELREAGLVAPEMQLAGDTRINQTVNYTGGLLWNFGANPWAGTPDYPRVLIDLDREATLARDPDALLNHLDLLLMSGQMPGGMKTAIKRRLGDWRFEWDDYAGYWRARAAIYLIVNSPQYLVQK